MTITKYSHDEAPATPFNANIPKKKSLHIKRKIQEPENSKALYCFDTFETFCDFCSFLQKSSLMDELSDVAKHSSLYEYNSNYYLLLTDLKLDIMSSRFVCTNITEFAHFVDNPELYERKVTEYGSLIMPENAINTCIENFV